MAFLNFTQPRACLSPMVSKILLMDKTNEWYMII